MVEAADDVPWFDWTEERQEKGGRTSWKAPKDRSPTNVVQRILDYFLGGRGAVKGRNGNRQNKIPKQSTHSQSSQRKTIE